MSALRWLAAVLGLAALWLAWQSAMLLFIDWYSTVEWESPHGPWLVGAEGVAFAICGTALLCFAFLFRRRRRSADRPAEAARIAASCLPTRPAARSMSRFEEVLVLDRTCRIALAAMFVGSMVAQEDPSAADVVGSDAAAWQAQRATKVLYAGWPDGSREASFRAFLQRHFDSVQVTDLAKLTKESAASFDVVIVDWASQYGKDGYPKRENSLLSAPGSLPDDFGVPVIAMDYVSSNLRNEHKLDWL